MSNVSEIIGALTLCFSNGFETMVLGRLFLGMGAGFDMHVAPIYLAECSPKNIRGAVVTLNFLALGIGQFSSFVVAYLIAGKWRLMLGLISIPCLIQIVALMFVPESPTYLIGIHKIEEAIDAYVAMGKSRAEAEIEVERIQKENDVTCNRLPWKIQFRLVTK